MRFPDPPADPALMTAWATDLVRSLNQLVENDAARVAGEFTATTTATSRSFDVSTATLAELGNVVGTLVADLQAR